MESTATIGLSEPPPRSSIAAIVTICTQQKRLKPTVGGTPAGLSRQPQLALETSWQRALAALPATTKASDLYAGRGFGLAKAAAVRTESPLFVISAGLGLVVGDQVAPAYGLTVSKNGPESIVDKVEGAFDPVDWFASVMAGARSTSWDRVGQNRPGRILVAMTRPYAEMAGASLAAAPRAMLNQLRIFGAGLAQTLPQVLRSAIVPYDDRLDALLPGTRSDFAQRALSHFVDSVAHLPADRETDAKAVLAILEEVAPPARRVRPQRSDAELLILIKGRLAPGASASRLLRQLRDQDGIACEQSRFSRLFTSAMASEGAT